ncbi:MAG: hypothetical protein II917_04550, partial [Synergistaceae bacterium]|nr:hypothetical protein [Synergistaceae bacterium]
MRLSKIKKYISSYITNHWDYYSELRLRRFVNSIRSFFKFQKNEDIAASVPSDLSLSYPAIKR